MTTTDITIIDGKQNEVAQVDFKQTAIDYLENMGMNLPKKYQSQFIELAKLYGLNPFKREIYAVSFGDKYNIITGYEVYLKRAERVGKLDGWNCVARGKGNEMTATLTIHRKDWREPFIHTVYYNECVQTTKYGQANATWKKMPSFMLRKVAIAQGFRMCFPDEFGGMPYTSDEMENDETLTLDAEPVENVEVRQTSPVQQVSVRQAEQVQEVDFEEVKEERRNPPMEQNPNEPQTEAEELYSLIELNKTKLDRVLSNGANPYQIAYDTIKSGDLDAINTMIERTKIFLEKQKNRTEVGA